MRKISSTKGLAIIIFLFAAAACKNNTYKIDFENQAPENRIEIVAAQRLGLSFENAGILILRDKKTGFEYLAVEGFGVTAMTDQAGNARAFPPAAETK